MLRKRFVRGFLNALKPKPHGRQKTRNRKHETKQKQLFRETLLSETNMFVSRHKWFCFCTTREKLVGRTRWSFYIVFRASRF